MRALFVLLLAAAIRAEAQSPEHVARFIADARRATERFKDIDVAIAERYVKIGPDFPAMGEHWVNGESVMKSTEGPRPSILTYTTIDGKPTLTGVVYTVILPPGKKPPELLPGAQWHDHVGSVDEESLLFGHDHTAPDGLRLSVMHAWVWTPNPEGTFATDNWDLPFTRVGLTRPRGSSPRAARGMALATSTSYYARLFSAVGELDDREADAVVDILDRAGDGVQRWLTQRPERAAVSAADVAQLEKVWTDVVAAVRAAIRPTSAAKLKAVLDQ
jgi:hypothetical protein